MSVSRSLALRAAKQQPVVLPSSVVEVAEVVHKDVPIVDEWDGTTDGLANATILAQVDLGTLMSQNYKEGDVVKRGRDAFEIDPCSLPGGPRRSQRQSFGDGGD